MDCVYVLANVFLKYRQQGIVAIFRYFGFIQYENVQDNNSGYIMFHTFFSNFHKTRMHMTSWTYSILFFLFSYCFECL